MSTRKLYAVRRLSDGLYRSRHIRGIFTAFKDVQLWDNPRTAAKEAKSYDNHKKHLGWREVDGKRVFNGYEDDPWPCEVITICVEEPKQ